MFNNVIEQAWKDYDPSLVIIDEEKIKELSFSDEDRKILNVDGFAFLKNKSIEESIKFLLGLNSINYQFWDKKGSEFTRYRNEGKEGAIASYESYVKFYVFLSENNFDANLINYDNVKVFFGNIPDLQQRVFILKEALNDNNLNCATKIIMKAAENGMINTAVAENVANVMPVSYKDAYLKKIQLALYEVVQIYKDKNINVNCDITVAADYQLPKVLEAMGVLKYCDSLRIKIENEELIEENSQEEKAIRSATIIACEKICAIQNIEIPALDRVLWLRRKEFSNKKFHLTKTRKY